MVSHRMAGSRIYNIWACMKYRCHSPKHNKYSRYGGRWITVCDRWRDSFENFYEDMKDGYEEYLEIDRINNNGNYEPWNCHWVTRMENAQNITKDRAPSRTHAIIHREKMTELAKEAWIPLSLLYARLTKWWTLEKCLSKK